MHTGSRSRSHQGTGPQSYFIESEQIDANGPLAQHSGAAAVSHFHKCLLICCVLPSLAWKALMA